jgi:hypothetical protein
MIRGASGEGQRQIGEGYRTQKQNKMFHGFSIVHAPWAPTEHVNRCCEEYGYM